MSKPRKLAKNLYLIDDFDLSWEERTGTYVLFEEELTIIETSASPSIPYLLQGLKELQISPEEVKYIIVTHIHLDHAGGAGLMLQHCPNAKVVVHPKGARHLADPSRLIAGARMVYGEKFDALFDPIVPIPEDRLIVKNHEEELSIGQNCMLKFYDSPGHANHHFSIYYPPTNAMFTGDTSGVYYPQLHRDGVELYLPSTSPNQFDPDKMRQSLSMFEKLNLDHIYFGHFGGSENVNEIYSQVRMWLNIFVDTASEAYRNYEQTEDQVQATEKSILAKVLDFLQSKEIPADHPAIEVIKLDINVCSQGLIHYLEHQNRKKS
ncbi:MBL fold metallo-hydrolase [Bacillus marasmi]|uniref:MBL fold metallo-hydrolase n=1 Tax=Bacillus marasmi TaxID=1926279 RepID=UPI0011C9477B|nr:MBL fold metallo-hydrolase [Bacillus marasmi]